MPSHSVIPSPIDARRFPLGRNMTGRSAGKSIQQRLGEKFRNTEVVKRSLLNEIDEWNDRRVWNDNMSGGPGGPLPELHPPPPPENLNWNDTPYRHREMSPNIETFMDFNDQPPRGREPEYNNEIFMGPERFPPNDFHCVVEKPRNNHELSNPELQDSYSSGGYPSFVSGRGDSNFLESSSPSFNYPNQRIGPREYSGQRGQGFDQWRPFEPPMEVAEKQRRDPSPRAPARSAGAPQILDKVFHIGGYKLPYITNEGSTIPQPESKSYLARFIKKNPPYRISIQKGKERSSVEHVFLESVDVNDLEEVEKKRFSLYRFREDVSKEFTKVYRSRFYRNWDGWWKDFHSINLDIDEQLAKFENFNVKYNFKPLDGTLDFVDLNKRARIALIKNRNNYLGNMRVLYSLMNHTVLGNMPMELVAKLQDLIRNVPNHLWIYKLRSVIYLWYNYKQVMDNKNNNDNNYHYVLKEWNSPVIHWVAKQAFLELRQISKFEFPEFRELYGKAEDAKA